MSIGYDLTFDINEFGNPKIKSELESIKDIILFILYTKPGQYPSMPQIGLDIDNLLYSHYDDIDIESLKNKIIDQCSALETFFDSNQVTIQKFIYNNNPLLYIQIVGVSKYPSTYQADDINTIGKYDIALTHDELNRLISNVKVVKN